MRKKAMDALMAFMDNIKIAQHKKISKVRLDKALGKQREAQFLIDFIEAENSYGIREGESALREKGRKKDAIALYPGTFSWRGLRT